MALELVVAVKVGLVWIALCIGSFINVFAHRFPPMFLSRERQAAQLVLGLEIEPGPTETLAFPSSRCPACRQPIPRHLNIPVLGWLLTRGACVSCKAPIHIKYLVVELIAGAGALAAVAMVQSPLVAAFYVGVGLLLLAAAAIDHESQILPDVVTYPLILIGLTGAYFHIADMDLHSALAGIAAVMLAWVVIDNIAVAIHGGPAMADGDWKLLMGVATLTGAAPLLPLMLVASLILCLQYVLSKTRSRELAFGPAIAVASVWAFLGGFEPILSFYRAWI